MSMKPVLLAFALAFATLATTGAAYAGVGITFGPGGIYVNPYPYDYDNRHYDNWGISRSDAIAIARANGVRYVDDVSRHHDTFVVSGETRRHHDITVTIDRSDGSVIDINRD